jgi:hypothetical protein
MPLLKYNSSPKPLCSGLPETSMEPLVAYYPHKEYTNVFSLKIHLFVADGFQPVLDTDINGIQEDQTQAGKLKLRQIKVNLEPVPPPLTDTYTLWQIDAEIEIQKGDPPTQGLRIMIVKGDPETTRGTVTTVSNTLTTVPH